MRSTTVGELTTLGLNSRCVTPRIKVANGSGTMIDLTSWFVHAKIEHDVDQPVGGATIDFVRASGPSKSLAPLRTDSTLNVNDVAAYSPQLDLNRIVTIEAATTPIGTAVVGGDYKLLFKGTIDVVNFEHSPVSVICRDLGAPLVDRWIEAEATYGSGGGTAIQTVMQNILDAVFGGGAYTLYTPVSPGFNIITYRQQRMSVMDALQDLVQLIGWDVRFKWDDGTSAFRLTLSEPPRTKTTPDYTFGPSQYFDFSQANLDITNIRNVVTGSFRDSAARGNRAVVTVSDSASITKYGRRFFLIQEADVSPIDTSSEMTTMVTAALADLKDSKVAQDVDMPFFWPGELSDLYRYSANLVHYNGNQDIAVVELTHDFVGGETPRHRTQVKVRGTPIGQYITWLGRGGTGPQGGQAYPPIPFIVPLNTEGADTAWNLQFDATYGSGGGGTNLTYTIKSKKTFGTETTLDSGNASAFPKSLTIARDPKQDAVITFTVVDAATGMSDFATWTVPAFTPTMSATGTIMVGGLDAAVVGPTEGQSRFRCELTNGISTNPSITTGTNTPVPWDTENFDVGGLHSLVSNTERITVPTGGNTGVWLLQGVVAWDTNTVSYREMFVRKNGSGALRTVNALPHANGLKHEVVAWDNNPSVGDYYELVVVQFSGSSRLLSGNGCFFSALHIW